MCAVCVCVYIYIISHYTGLCRERARVFSAPNNITSIVVAVTDFRVHYYYHHNSLVHTLYLGTYT